VTTAHRQTTRRNRICAAASTTAWEFARDHREEPRLETQPQNVWMICDNCGTVDSGPEGAMYECPSCGGCSGWGAESHVEAQARSESVKSRFVSTTSGSATAKPSPRCKDFPDVLVSDAEALEIGLRLVLDEDEACDAARVVLQEGWRKQ
jgi:hypothetical protein